MTPEEHIQKLRKDSNEFRSFFNNQLPHIVGIEAVNFYKESFQNEGFTDQVLEKWQEVKRRINPRTNRAASSRAILTGDTADLGRSIDFHPEGTDVKITADTRRAGSDKDYAAAHNEGTTTAGRGNKTTIPKRPFIKESETLNKKIEKISADKIHNLLK